MGCRGAFSVACGCFKIYLLGGVGVNIVWNRFCWMYLACDVGYLVSFRKSRGCSQHYMRSYNIIRGCIGLLTVV